MKQWGILVKRSILFAVQLPLLLMAYHDADLDGVADEHDQCPNSALTDIVDQRGCTIEKLTPPKKSIQDHFDVMVGISQLKTTHNHETQFNQSLQLDYYHQDLTLQLQSTHYEEGSWGDTSMALFYHLKPMPQLILRMGTAVILPTYESRWDNNQADYRLSSSLTYQLLPLSLFLGGSYTFINDEDINQENYQLHYQDSNTLYFGLGGYLLPKLYSSCIYTQSRSIYQGGSNLHTLSLYNHYMIDAHWFTRFGYTQGVSDDANDQLYLSVGYYF